MEGLIGEIIAFLIICLIEFCFIAYLVVGFRKIAVGECYEGVIDRINYEGRRRGGVHEFGIYIKTYINYQETSLWSLEEFTSMWFYKGKWERLKRKYIGKKVHIYVNPKKPYGRTITKELCWRYFLPKMIYSLLLFITMIFFVINFVNKLLLLF